MHSLQVIHRNYEAADCPCCIYHYCEVGYAPKVLASSGYFVKVSFRNRHMTSPWASNVGSALDRDAHQLVSDGVPRDDADSGVIDIRALEPVLREPVQDQ